jgi:formylglycine-generating enzyme required for sulfatase activity
MKLSLLVLLCLTGFCALSQEPLRINHRQTNYRSCGTPNLYANSFELTNGEYLDYTLWVQQNLGTDAYTAALPDTTVWRSKFSFNEKYVTYYLRHPAYKDYPIVGLSYKQALAYCEWLSKQTNATLHDPQILQIVFRLPTEEEWEKAALGGLPDNTLYPWGTHSLYIAKGKFKGFAQANVIGTRYAPNRDTYTLFNGHNYYDTNGDITSPVRTYKHNQYGLYHIIGNVAEMVADPEISKGGSWQDELHEATIQQAEKLERPTNANVGIRIFAEVVAYQTSTKLPNVSAKSIENTCSFVAQKDSAFYISNFEVSNALYNAYLSSLEDEKLKKSLPKDSLWCQETSILQYTQYHTQFPSHPVCNIDKASMLDFCQWLENQYNNDPKRAHSKIEISLPTYEEWYTAAGGPEQRLFSWLSHMPTDRNATYLMNFSPLPEHLFVDPYLYRKDSAYRQTYRKEVQKARRADGYDFTCPVGAFDLTQMRYKDAHLKKQQLNGNVAEALLDVPLAIGGSFASFEHECHLNDEMDLMNPHNKKFGQEIPLPSPQVGFRFIYRVVDAESVASNHPETISLFDTSTAISFSSFRRTWRSHLLDPIYYNQDFWLNLNMKDADFYIWNNEKYNCYGKIEKWTLSEANTKLNFDLTITHKRKKGLISQPCQVSVDLHKKQIRIQNGLIRKKYRIRSTEYRNERFL